MGIAILGVICIWFATRKNYNNSQPRTVCVAYSTDSNYVYPTVVSMTSLMENANKNTFCKFTVLTSDGVTQEGKEDIKSIANHYKNCSINIVDMGEKFSNSEERFWSKAMYYRLSLPQILKDEQRCLYVDCDTMIKNDICEIFEIPMENYYIAGVHDFNVYINPQSKYFKDIGIPNLNSYVCSGVLLMNLEKMRNDNLNQTLDTLIEQNNKNKNFKFPDQDALNVACYGHILVLPFKYGALAHTDFSQPYTQSEYAQWAYNAKQWDEGRKNPVIVHFTGTKPWNEIYSELCKEWIEYAKKSACKEKILKKYNLA